MLVRLKEPPEGTGPPLWPLGTNATIATMRLTDLHPNEGQIQGVPANPRQISEKDFADLQKSIRSFIKMMALRPIIVDENNDILGGNMRYRALCKLRDEKAVVEIKNEAGEITGYYRFDDEVPDKWVNQVTDLTPAEKREFLIKDNIEKGEWDYDRLANDDWDLGELEEWGIDAAAWNPETAEEGPEENTAKEDDFDENQDLIPSRSKPGDIWTLGDHRLLVGDSTRKSEIERLMAGETADLWLTDPPYNVAVQNSKGMKIANDNMASEEFGIFLHEAFAAAEPVIKPGGAFYVWFASCEHINFERALNDCGLKVRQELVWNKNALVLGRQDYQWKHEPVLYGWKSGAAHYFIDSRREVSVIPDTLQLDINKMKKEEMAALLKKIYQDNEYTSVMDFNKPTRDADHPTMKPVELFGYLVRNSSRRGEIVLDTFGGSGTTIVACEQLGRRARVVELDPHYADVILARWEKLTGKIAHLESRKEDE